MLTRLTIRQVLPALVALRRRKFHGLKLLRTLRAYAAYCPAVQSVYIRRCYRQYCLRVSPRTETNSAIFYTMPPAVLRCKAYLFFKGELSALVALRRRKFHGLKLLRTLRAYAAYCPAVQSVYIRRCYFA